MRYVPVLCCDVAVSVTMFRGIEEDQIMFRSSARPKGRVITCSFQTRCFHIDAVSFTPELLFGGRSLSIAGLFCGG
jgi:hypothetical protein